MPRPIAVSAEAASATSATIAWRPPPGDAAPTGYRIEATGPDGLLIGSFSADADARSIKIAGLAAGQAYTFWVRAVLGSSVVWSPPVVAYLDVAADAPALKGAIIPIADEDNQTVIVRLGGVDCRIHLWWQPSDESWYASMEVPVNTLVVAGRRVAVNSGLLDRVAAAERVGGNVFCRAGDDDSRYTDPERDAWGRHTHFLIWESA